MRKGKVAVWLADKDDDASEAEIMHVIACITGDWLKAYYVISGRDVGTEYKGVVAGPVERETAEVIVSWLESVGARAAIDADYYGD